MSVSSLRGNPVPAGDLDIDRAYPEHSRWQFVTARLMVILLAVACLVMTLRAGSDRDVAVARTVPVTVMPRDATPVDGTVPRTTPGSLDTDPAAAWTATPAAADAESDDATAEDEPAEEPRDDAEPPPAPVAEEFATARGDEAPEEPVEGARHDDIAAGVVAPVPAGELQERYAVASWSDFTAGLLELKIGWGRATGTNRFKILLSNESPTLMRNFYVVVYARNDTISPPRREVWPSTIIDDELHRNPTGGLLSSTIRRSWDERSDKARGRKVSLAPGAMTSLGVSMPLRAHSQNQAWEGEPIEPVGFIEFLLWIFDEDGALVFTRRYECLPPARR